MITRLLTAMEPPHAGADVRQLCQAGDNSVCAVAPDARECAGSQSWATFRQRPDICLRPRPEARMVNGQSIVIKGDISGGEDLVIAGRVEGSITLSGRVLTLAAGSQVLGTVSAASVVVSGAVEGSVEASERLEVRETAVIDGDISAPTLLVADGAHLKATVDMPGRGAHKQGLAGVA